MAFEVVDHLMGSLVLTHGCLGDRLTDVNSASEVIELACCTKVAYLFVFDMAQSTELQST